MIKTKKAEIPPAHIDPLFVNWFASASNDELGRIEHQLMQYGTRSEQIRRQVRDYVQQIRQLKDGISQLESERAGIDIDAYKETAKQLAERIKRLPFVEKVYVRNGELKVKTRLIFTNIRTGDGERTTKRKCIGAFLIKLNIGQHFHIQVQNLMMRQGRYHHWAISNQDPCLGDWQDEFRNASHRKDLYRVIELCYHYLRSTDDGGAYTSSHRWIAGASVSVGARPVRKGGYVIMIDDYHDDFTIPAGYVAQVLSTSDNTVMLEFKEPIGDDDSMTGHDGDGLGEYGHCWEVLKDYVRAITKEQYESNISMSDLQNGTMAQVDALPEGSTLSDAKKILVK